jgi:hypothetical protein
LVRMYNAGIWSLRKPETKLQGDGEWVENGGGGGGGVGRILTITAVLQHLPVSVAAPGPQATVAVNGDGVPVTAGNVFDFGCVGHTKCGGERGGGGGSTMALRHRRFDWAN